jgi:hypothetical protein
MARLDSQRAQDGGKFVAHRMAWGVKREASGMRAYRILIYEHGEAPQELAAELLHDQRAYEYASMKLADSARVSMVEVWSERSLLTRLTSEPQRVAA